MRLRIVVLGYIVRGPIGGLAWHHLQYALGLVRLGHDVRFVEDSDDYASCYDPSRHVIDTDPTYGLKFAAETFSRFGCSDLWAYFDAHTNTWMGPAATDAADFCRNADVVLNVSMVNPLREWTAEVPQRVAIDTDPAFTQIRNLSSSRSRSRSSMHTRFMTFGENIATGKANAPDDGFRWQRTRQPIVLDVWPVIPPNPAAPYTTVMQWQSYATLRYGDSTYGAKSASFDAFLDLPRHTGMPLEIALGGADAPREQLVENGWRLTNPLEVARTSAEYQQYIRNSRGEFSVAKQGYVVSNSGWFSERSAAYLASGRPVIAQDTGFSEWLPCGDGLFAFNNPAQASAAIAAVEENYEHHSAHARKLAENYFDSASVLSDLIDAATCGT